ncbi:hypothetical protein GJR95_08615 [Spirosoma endbachense]|uniref:Uncharacterized protein n=2 Tax=Spirosoma endbachense TaxID=2666025 RepID=A0A6P1VSW8_9BACT|nr:hypothetical protein GJR95_08615 [Spirosoma endbachense]
MLLLFVIWLLYTLKSSKYVASQLKLAPYQFLFYSSNALARSKQLQTWFIVQLIISIPIITLGLFAVTIGVAFDHYLISFLIPFYLVALIFSNALYFTHLVNNLANEDQKTTVPQFIRHWPKPFFSLFLYEIIDSRKLTFGVTKFISGLIISLIYVLFLDLQSDIRIPELLIISVILTHMVLIYQANEFDLTYLRFARNFPYSPSRLYCQFIQFFLLLLVPEFVWVFLVYDPITSTTILLLGLSTALLFRTLLYRLAPGMSNYLRLIFCLFLVLSLAILFGGLWVLIVSNLICSFFLLYFHRFKSLDS